jgi:hypothetical protein
LGERNEGNIGSMINQTRFLHSFKYFILHIR